MPDITKMQPKRYILLVWSLGSWSIAVQADEGEYDSIIRPAITKIKAYTPRKKWMLVDFVQEVHG